MGLLDKIFKSNDTTMENSPLEYVSIIQDLQRFRGSARVEGDKYDFPNQIFFKILFHFHNNSDAESTVPSTRDRGNTDHAQSYGTGLLHPTWLNFVAQDSSNEISIAQQNIDELWNYNTAWAYLVENNEISRANNLRSFVEMLSNINSNTPWYFQNVKGLDGATNRDIITKNDFVFSSERQRITIECLPDAYDQRISTLLDLYRSVVWSWEMKREMVPANLRKFDMTIIAFQMPIKGLNSPRESMKLSNTIMRNETKIAETNEGFAVIYDTEKLGANVKLTSYKAWEFHGCEFEYNSSKGTFETISNAEGTTTVPTIEILYDDCYEIRFNEFLGRHISDLMGDDQPYNTDSSSNTSAVHTEPNREADGSVYELPSVSPDNISQHEDADPSWLEQAVGGLMEWGKTKVKEIYLGNLSGLSISKISQQLGELDNLGATVSAIKDYAQGDFNGLRERELGDLTPETTKLEQIKKLGNIYTSKTRANS